MPKSGTKCCNIQISRSKAQCIFDAWGIKLVTQQRRLSSLLAGMDAAIAAEGEG